MASSVAYALCIVLCICSLQTAVQAKREKLSLTVYVHETRAGPNISILAAAGTGQGNFSALGWGSLLVSENIVKQGPSADSAVLGRCTGSGLISTKGGVADGGFQVINKIWFSPESKYNGSSITVIGTFGYPLAPWELTAVAGTGLFRGYYGYALASSESAVSPLFVYKYEFHLYRLW